MTAFATIDDYEKLYPGQVPDARQALVSALESACDDIRDYTHQKLDAIAGETVVLDGSGTHWLLLPQVPVTAVASITAFSVLPSDWSDWSDCEPAPSVPTPVTDFTWKRDGTLYRISLWPAGSQNVTVVYDHGYTTIPSNLVRVACELARITLTAPLPGMMREAIAGYSYQREPRLFTVDDFAHVLDRHKQRAVNV